MSSPGICSRCGAPLPRSALGRRCPRCLLESALGDEPDQEIAAPPLPDALTGGRAPAPRRFGDYELLEEIARGGMGVVYRARQVSLNRQVAVKMVLSGSYARPEFLRRFRAEAEAAANLHHPNIVAIHEFGESKGQPFYSMDYVEGRSLAETVATTLRQVQDTDPLAPRLLNPSVPRDLERICLKCLEKDPRRRYPTAQDLADELERYLNGTPFAPGRCTGREKLWRWCRRNPRLAILSGMVAVLSLIVVVGTPAAIYRINGERQAALRHPAEESRQRGLADAALHRNELRRAQELFASDWRGGMAR
jgi:hypothetical protein